MARIPDKALLIILFTAWTAGASVPDVCVGWPKPDSAIINSTNYHRADLPPLLMFVNGTTVKTARAWAERRVEIKLLLQRYMYGSLPQETPPLVGAHESSPQVWRGLRSWTANLTFLTNGRANVSIGVEIIVPQTAGSHPIFLTQRNHRRWALKGVARGFAACVYPGADIDDQSSGFRRAYPEASWGTILSRAWLASRCLDYMVQSVPGLNTSQVSISGHSRNGKQAMLAAAFDDRITSVVSSSSGSPGMCPYRTTSANTFAEGPGDAPPQWWIPELSCFKGYEHRLPIDSHALLGLIAPRSIMAATAWTDGCEPTWAVERAYKAAREVYRWLGVSEKLRIKYRPGQHHGFLDVDSYFDWFDTANGRPGFCHSMFPESLLQDFDWNAWSAVQPEEAKAPAPGATREQRIRWGLGVQPAGGAASSGHYGEQCEPGSTADGCFVAQMMTHDRYSGHTGGGVQRQDVNFGEYISASVYFPKNHSAREPLPVVIWLHPLSYDSGFNEGYIESESQTAIYFDIAYAGFAVIAFDQMGFGTRGYEFNGAAGGSQAGSLPLFYRRYPEWSVTGKMVHDTQAAIDLVHTQGEYPGLDPPYSLPVFDKERVFMVGYGIGGSVALHTAALDSGAHGSRIAGVVSINGFSPMRTDTADASSGGIRRLFDWHGLQPRLGYYDGKEADLPYDFDDVLIQAGVPTLVVQQDYDRMADPIAVKKCVQAAVANGAEVTYQTYPMVNSLNDQVHERTIVFLQGLRVRSSASNSGLGVQLS